MPSESAPLEVIVASNYYRCHRWSGCEGSAWEKLPEVDRRRYACEAKEWLDTIAAAGLAIIELPELMNDREGVVESLRDQPMWCSEDSWAVLLDTEIEFEADSQNAYGSIVISKARSLAAVLLAAANAAEAQA